MLNIIIFGPPGVGKGTQAEKISEKYGFSHMSTGDVIRNEVKRGTELGEKARKQMDGGRLASDEMVIGIIDNFIDGLGDIPGVIYDGFPRTIPQAEALDKMLAARGEKIAGMLALDIDDEELIRRIIERGKLSGREDDQSIDIIKNRINVYNEETAPLIDYYKKQGKYYPVKSVLGIEAVFDKLCKVIDGLK